jgi:AIPR protein
MSADSSYVLRNVIEKSRLQDKPGWKPDEYFELFAAQQTLKLWRFNLDPTEIESGIVGGGGDGGVDGFYLFVNRKFVREDTDPQIFNDQQLNFELVILQSKHTTSFEESVPQKLKDFAEQGLPMGSTLGAMQQKLFGEALLAAVKKFHDIYDLGLLKQPKLTIFYAHVSLGEQIDPKVDVRRDLLVAKTREIFPTADVQYAYLTGTNLLTLFNQHPEQTIPLVTQDYFDSKLHQRSGYVCLATLPDFYEFIADKDVLQEHLFEANVRAHAPDVKVNKGISTTLANPEQEDFCWLNNGITILASAVIYNDRKLHITNPLVVNGLQTSYEIFNHFSAGASRDDKRTLLVRVIVIDAESATSDKIITATNSQTKIEAINLHATEQIQRHIEMALKAHDLYYDRRKN